jgi:sugar phosphate isomerase/epimerase
MQFVNIFVYIKKLFYEQGPIMMKLGLSSYSYTWALGIPGFGYDPVMDIFGLVEKTNDHQLSLLQVADNAPLHTLTATELDRLKNRCDQLNIELEVGSKGLTPENLDRYIRIAAHLESKILRFVLDDVSLNYKPGLREVKEIIGKAEKALVQRNILLAIENHDRYRAIDFQQLIREIGSPNVGICLDCANSLGTGEGIYETVSVLAPYTVNLHLKDITIQRKPHMMGFDIHGAAFGKGLIPLQWVIEEMPSRCRTGILELWMPPEDSWETTFRKEEEWVKMSLDYLRKELE